MADQRDYFFRRGRIAQFLHERGYPVNQIPEDGLDESGYETFSFDERVGERRMNPWFDPEDWRGVVDIHNGKWT